ncbi:MAG: hypothetical protein R3E95_16580 [Thiolinea sp.]
MRRDPAILAATPDIPVQLIEPVADSAATSATMALAQPDLQAGSLTNDRLLQDDADATWGIHAVRADTSLPDAAHG